MGPDRYAAVLFCEKGKITREMMYAEFEAILDSFVPLPENAGLEVQAIYVEVSPQLKVLAAVYFLIGFDGAGHADRKWNIPLQQLAEQGEPGPNLGAGPIRLACRSQCPVSWHVQHLWDPNMQKSPNDFVLLRDVIKRNKLGFKKVEEEAEEIVPVVSETPPSGSASNLLSALVGEDASETDKALSSSLVKFLRQKLNEESVSEREEMAKRQTLLLAAQKTKFEDEIAKLEDSHGEELREMQAKLQEYHQQLTEYKKQSEKLQQQLTEQNQSMVESKKLFEQKLEKNKEIDNSQIDAFKKNLMQEMQRKIEALAKEYSDELAAKDMEISYRDEEKLALEKELAKLAAEKALLISQGGEQFLNRLRDNKVSFVVYHQGPGHINIDIDSIGEYLSNPIAYVAKSCKVSEEAYRQWIKHYDNPVCQSFSEAKGDVCGKKLKAVTSPTQFVMGRSDRCPLHWSFSEGA
jgi:hypothetical protein